MVASVPYDITDLKVWIYNGTTYGSAIDVPGVQQLNLGVEGTADTSYGDGGVYATIVTERTASGSITTAGINAAAFAALSGGSVVTNGTGNTAGTHLIISAALNLPYVQIQGLAPTGSSDGGVSHIVIPLGRVTSGPDFTFSRDIPTYEFGYEAQAGPGNAFGWLSQWADATKALPTSAATALPV